jgi:hypothetical protein
MGDLTAKHNLTQRGNLWYRQGQIFVPPQEKTDLPAGVRTMREDCMAEHHDTPSTDWAQGSVQDPCRSAGHVLLAGYGRRWAQVYNDLCILSEI